MDENIDEKGEVSPIKISERTKKALVITAAASAAATLLFFILTMAIDGSPFFLTLAMISASVLVITGIVALVLYLRAKYQLSFKPGALALPITAIVLEVALPALFAVLTFAIRSTSSLMFLFLFVFSPIIGMLLGVGALCRGKAINGKAGIILSIVAIVLPIVTVFVIILLFSTGAIIIGM